MASYKKHPPLYPISVYLGQYESWLLTIYGSRTLRFAAKRLERFFDFFPFLFSLDEFTAADVEAFIRNALVARENKWSSISIHLGVIQRFFQWAIEEKNLPIINPVVRGGTGKLSIYAETGKALFPEPQPKRNPFVHVQAPALGVRTPILDEDDFLFVIQGIDEFESCT